MTAQRRRTDAAERILDAATELAQTRGFNGFSYADIAERLVVTKASLHYHFASKADLGHALIERYHVAFVRALTAIERDVRGTPEKLRRYVELFDSVMRNDRMCLCGMLAAEYATLPERMQSALRTFFDANEAWLGRVLRDGRRAGELAFAEPPPERARLLSARSRARCSSHARTPTANGSAAPRSTRWRSSVLRARKRTERRRAARRDPRERRSAVHSPPTNRPGLHSPCGSKFAFICRMRSKDGGGGPHASTSARALVRHRVVDDASAAVRRARRRCRAGRARASPVTPSHRPQTSRRSARGTTTPSSGYATGTASGDAGAALAAVATRSAGGATTCRRHGPSRRTARSRCSYASRSSARELRGVAREPRRDVVEQRAHLLCRRPLPCPRTSPRARDSRTARPTPARACARAAHRPRRRSASPSSKCSDRGARRVRASDTAET